jgi:hypothetical protein
MDWPGMDWPGMDWPGMDWFCGCSPPNWPIA